MTDNGTPVRFQVQGSTALLALGEQLDDFDGHAVYDAYRQAAARGAQRIVLDFAGLLDISQSGVAELHAMLRDARHSGREVIFAGV
jgi:anti-anti-sigma regulatory factor